MYNPIYVFSLCMSGLGNDSLVIIQPRQSLYNHCIPNVVSWILECILSIRMHPT